MSKTKNNNDEKNLRKILAESFKKLWKWCSKKEQDSSLRDTIEELIEEDDEDEPSIDNDEKVILGNVLNLKDLTAEDLMVPYANIIAISIIAKSDEVFAAFIKSDVSQVPVFVETVDNIVGQLSMRDALSFLNSKKKVPLKSFVKDVLYIAPTMRILDLLLQMRETGIRLAVVIDEYGGVSGIVTFADLIEEIIGDIQYEEDDSSEDQIEVQQNGYVILNAGTLLNDLDESLEKLCGTKINWLQGLDNEDIDTIGGVVTLLAGRVPMCGELIVHPLGFEFEILDSDPRKVKKIAIRNVINNTIQPVTSKQRKAN